MGIRHELEITVGPDGSVKIHVRGMEGKGCLEATRFLEEALGPLVDRENTAEYYLAQETHPENRTVPLLEQGGDQQEIPTGA